MCMCNIWKWLISLEHEKLKYKKTRERERERVINDYRSWFADGLKAAGAAAIDIAIMSENK